MDENTQLLRDILTQQKEQTDLLRRHLTRIRFSLLALLLLMTLVGVSLGTAIYLIRPKTPTAAFPPPVMPSTYQVWTAPNSPSGTFTTGTVQVVSPPVITPSPAQK